MWSELENLEDAQTRELQTISGQKLQWNWNNIIIQLKEHMTRNYFFDFLKELCEKRISTKF